MPLVELFTGQQALFSRNRKVFMLGIYTVCFLLYLSAGGTLFFVYEGPEIEKGQRDILDVKIKIMQKFTNVSGEALDAYLNELRLLGVRGLPDPNGTTTQWTFADAVFFAATLLTTIGYGHVSPKTMIGKLICMIFTGFGIPVTLIFLASYVERLMGLSEWYKATLFQKLQNMPKPLPPMYIRLTHIGSIMVLILLLCFILPAVVFAHYEKGWGVFDGIYFCFISLTTVGLGDLVPALDAGMPYVELYKYGATFFLIAGITIMMFVMAMTADFHQNYNCCYESLPLTISSETISINPNNTVTYGTILMQSENSEEEKITIPP